MVKVNPQKVETATGNVKTIFDDLKKKTGSVPNIFRNMALSPSVLEGFMKMNEAAAKTSLKPLLREQIALAVAQSNKCNYCLSAHTAIGLNIGLTSSQTIQARKGESDDAKTRAILKFAKSVVDSKANLNKGEISTLFNAGVTEQELVEILFVISVNMFTNYFNHITDPVIDFPVATTIS